MVLLEALDNQRKSLVLIVVKKTQTFAHVCIIMVIIVIHLLIKKQSLSLKLTKHMVIFQLYFVLEVFLRRNAYDFLVNYNSIDKSDILNIFNNLMVKNNINK